MTFEAGRVPVEEESLVNSWVAQEKQFGRKFLDYWLFGRPLVSKAYRMAADRERGFYFIMSGEETRGSDGPVINPTYFFYLWWKGGFVEIYSKMEEKRRKMEINGRIRNKLYFLKYNIFKMYLHQDEPIYSREYLFSVIEEAFKSFKSWGNDPYYDSYLKDEGVVVNYDNVELIGDWEG